MFRSSRYTGGFSIDHVATCDFEKLLPVTNDKILEQGGRKADPRLIRFMLGEIGIENRYIAPKNIDALDLARDALSRLLAQDPTLRDEAEFLIYCGISNPMPTVCHAAILANENEFKNASCWDIKSGCSTGVLGIVQALEWFQHGTKRGVIVASESFSKFTNPETLELAATSGDGAVAISISASDAWQVRGVVHGTDPTYFKSAYVPGKYPIDQATYKAEDYWFAFDAKTQAAAALDEKWVASLKGVLEVSGLQGKDVTHYVSHQINAKKNRAFAEGAGIPSDAIFENFRRYGNMGCPTILINYAAKNPSFKKGDVMVLQAVGGGISHAAVSLQKVK